MFTATHVVSIRQRWRLFRFKNGHLQWKFLQLTSICITVGFIVSMAGCRGDNNLHDNSITGKNSKQDVDEISKFVNAIDARPHTLTIKKQILGIDDGGYIIGSYDQHDLVKVDVWLGMSNHVSTWQYYFKNGRLIFAKRNQQYYVWDQQKGQIDRNHFSKTNHDEYYFVPGKLVAHVKSGEKFYSDLHSQNDAIIARARMYIKLLSAQQKTVYINESNT